MSPGKPSPSLSSCSLRLALLLYLVEAMSGCWVIEQPSGSILRWHPRIMDVFSHFKDSWFQVIFQWQFLSNFNCVCKMHGFGKFGELKGTPSIEIYGSARIRSIPIIVFISCIYEGASTKIGLHFCSHTKVHRKQPRNNQKLGYP